MRASIRTFLLLNLLIALTFTFLLTLIGSYYLDIIVIYHDADSSLSQYGFLLQALAEDDAKANQQILTQKRLNKVSPKIADFSKHMKALYANSDYHEKYQFQVWNNNKQLILHSRDAPKISLLSDKTGFSDKQIGNIRWRVFTIKDSYTGFNWAIAENYKIRDNLVDRITLNDAYIMILIYPLSGCLIWFIVGRGLRIIKRVTNEVSRRAADHLNPVDLEAIPVEIQPLIDELNKLFLRLKQAFEREQRFAADAAHELRTPLAALRTQAQVALKTIDAHTRQLQLQSVIGAVDRCTHVVQQLLTLCRINPDAAALEDTTEIDLVKIAAEVIAQLAPIAIDKKIEIELTTKDPACTILGNNAALHALVRNLVDNAIRYTPEGGNIKVIIQREINQVVLRVTDTGPGIPPDLRARVFERFFRVLGSTAPGSGLGLAIVLQIVKLHKGNVRLGVPASGKGLEVEVTLPYYENDS